MIYCSCTYNWPFYWKSCVTCSFSEKQIWKCVTDVCFHINLLRWLEPYDLVLSLLLIMIVTGGSFRCIYQVFFESTFFSKHHCKVVVFSKISLLHHNFYNIFPIDLSNSCVVVSGQFWILYWCRQAGFQVFYMTHKYLRTNWYIHIVWTPPLAPLSPFQRTVGSKF